MCSCVREHLLAYPPPHTLNMDWTQHTSMDALHTCTEPHVTLLYVCKAQSTRFWPTRLAKPLLPVSCAAQARPEDARRAATGTVQGVRSTAQAQYCTVLQVMGVHSGRQQV